MHQKTLKVSNDKRCRLLGFFFIPCGHLKDSPQYLWLYKDYPCGLHEPSIANYVSMVIVLVSRFVSRTLSMSISYPKRAPVVAMVSTS